VRTTKRNDMKSCRKTVTPGRPVGPPVYQPQPTPKVLQTKLASGLHKQVERSGVGGQKAPGILQLKKPLTNHPPAPPVYRPTSPKIAQMKTTLAAQAGKTALPPPNYHPQPTQRSLPNRISTTIQAASCWDWLTSCFSSKSKVRVEEEEQELVQRPVVIIEPVKKKDVTVAMDDYTELEDGVTYTPSHLTNCAMVFAIGADAGCVYHWPFHTWSQDHISTLERAMKEFEVTRPVRYYIFGMDASSQIAAEKQEKSWREFGNSFKYHFKAIPQMFLVKEPYTMPSLKYSGGGVTTFIANRPLKLD